jgi:hypothetical protein
MTLQANTEKRPNNIRTHGPDVMPRALYNIAVTLSVHFGINLKNLKEQLIFYYRPIVGFATVMLLACFFLTEHHAMKAYCGIGSIAPRIL